MSSVSEIVAASNVSLVRLTALVKCKFTKVVFSILVIAGFAMAAYHTYTMVDYYLSYPKWVNVAPMMTKEVMAPAMTVCSANIVKKSKLANTRFASWDRDDLQNLPPMPNATHFTSEKIQRVLAAFDSKDPEILASLKESLLVRGDVSKDDFDGLLKQSPDLQHEYLRKFLHLKKDELDNVGIQGDELIKMCSFTVMGLKMPCSPDIFKKVQNAQFGNCYQVMTPPEKRHNIKDKMKLVLDLQPEETVDALTPVRGIAAIFFHSAKNPFYYTEPYFVRAGHYNKLAVKATMTKHLQPPYGMCEESDDEEDWDMGIKHHGKGDHDKDDRKKRAAEEEVSSYVACWDKCIGDKVKEHCGCTMLKHSKWEDPEEGHCNPWKQEEHLCSSVTKHLVLKSKDKGCRCAPPCRQAFYSARVSAIPLSGKGPMRKPMQEPDPSKNRSHLETYAVVEMGYDMSDGMPVTMVTELPVFSMADLIGKVGVGIICITGLSLVGILESFFICCWCVGRASCCRKKKSEKEKMMKI